MPYIIAAPCVADYACVDVCPVNCISPRPDEAGFAGTEQLYIDPSRCINCEACAEICPVDAIYADDALPEKWAGYAAINADYFAQDRAA